MMNIQRLTLFVDGMTCPACETRIAKGLLAIGGVTLAEAQVRGGRVDIEYDEKRTGRTAFIAAIEAAGYTVRGKGDTSTAIALGIGLLLVAAYIAAAAGGVFHALPPVDASIGYAMLFVVGLLTSIHCVAMCGGIALSQSVRGEASGANPTTPPAERLRRLEPGLLYNAGRVMAYTAIGGLVGGLGAVFSFSSAAKAIIAGIAGALMVLFGLRMLGVLKALPSLAKFVPAELRDRGSKLAAGLRRRGPFAVGLLNGLMPCGPLQTMQLYALGTGSALAGAAAMFVFAIGTVPLLLTFGLTAALLPRKFLPVMVKTSAVLVMFLGVVVFGRAAALGGLALPGLPAYAARPALSATAATAATAAQPTARAGIQTIPVSGRAAASATSLRATIADGVQSVTTEFINGNYVPFTVQAGVPLKWTVRVTAAELNGCNNPLTVPAYGIRKTLVPGDNLVEFTPKKAGVIAYTCWMGMVTSRITVVSDLGGVAAVGTGREPIME